MSDTTSPAAALRTLGVAPDTYGPTINTARSPRDVDVLGRALGTLVADANPQTLAVWNTCDEAVLAHAVALQLGATVSRVSEVEGILIADEPIVAGARVAILATEWGDWWLETLRRLVSGCGGEIVVVAAVVGSEALEAVSGLVTVSLVSADDARESAP